MILPLVKKPLRYARNVFKDWQTARYVHKRLARQGLESWESFNFDDFKRRVVGFVKSMQVDDSGIRFRYSASCTHPTLYASAYACMTYSLLGELKNYNGAQKKAWAEYFDSFQNESDGLFYDPVVMNDLYPDTDWWGARHLALHMISAYTDLGARPRHPFRFLSKYYDTDRIKSWLDRFDWYGESIGVGDVDNKIMNIGCLLQYQRDYWADRDAGNSIDYLKHYLREKINREIGMWGGFNACDSNQRSRMVQFSYHLFPLFFYDNNFDFDHEKIVANILNTQNKYGGYGVKVNSSACEDIDSIDILMRLHPYASQSLKSDIDRSLNTALCWVLLNQMEDGGFVFRLNQKMKYGHLEMMSAANKGAMFPTWFRVLSISYLMQRQDSCFAINRAPGLVF